MKNLIAAFVATTIAVLATPVLATSGAFLEITAKVNEADRPAAAAIYVKYKQPFLKTVTGAKSKALLVRKDDIQVLHGFDTVENAKAYLGTKLFKNDVVKELKPHFQAAPEIRIYKAN